MMGSSDSDLKAERKRTPVRVSTSANASPSSVDNTPTRDRQHQRVPGHAAGGAGIETGDAPDLGIGQALEERRQRPAAIGVAERDDQHLQHRQTDEQQRQRDHQAQRAGDKGVAADQAAQRQAARQQEQESGAGDQGAVTHAELALLGLADQLRQPGQRSSRAGRTGNPGPACSRCRPGRQRSAAGPAPPAESRAARPARPAGPARRPASATGCAPAATETSAGAESPDSG